MYTIQAIQLVKYRKNIQQLKDSQQNMRARIRSRDESEDQVWEEVCEPEVTGLSGSPHGKKTRGISSPFMANRSHLGWQSSLVKDSQILEGDRVSTNNLIKNSSS
jgi:hypothetical protein